MSAIIVLLHEDDRAARLVELERHLGEALQSRPDALLCLFARDVEEEEPAAARAEELAAGRAGPHPLLVGRVDRGVRDPLGQRFLDPPALGQYRPEGVDVVGLQPVFELARHLAEPLGGLDLGRVAREVPRLDPEDLVGVPHVARVEHQKAVLEPLVGFVPHDDRLDPDEAVGAELIEFEPAEGRRELVLLADRVAELDDLDVAGLRKLAAARH